MPSAGGNDMPPVKKDPDVQLMLRFKDGDEDAFRELFAKYQNQIINFCYRFCFDRELAEDLAQEAFLRVYRGGRRYRPKARFSTWLYRIAVNVCLNEVRKMKKYSVTQSLDRTTKDDSYDRRPEYGDKNQVPADEMMSGRQREQQIKTALRNLPKEQRAAVVLRIYNEFSYKDIADQMSVSEGKVKTLIFRGRQALKESLREVV